MKPSKKIDELYLLKKKEEGGDSHTNYLLSIIDYLDEQWEAGQKAGIGCVVETNPD